MPFGKYRGHPLSALPEDYIDWVLSLDDIREPLRSRLAAESFRRAGYREPEPPPRTGPIDGDLASMLIEAGRRALAVKCHPDNGGDLRTMQNVNATADKLLAQYPRRRGAA